MQVSFSKLQLFDHCPSQFAARYVTKVPEIKSAPLVAGIMAHSVVEIYRNHLQKQQVSQDLDVIPSVVEAAFSHNPEIRSTECYNDVAMVAASFSKSYVHNPEGTLGIEAFLSRTLVEKDEAAEFGFDEEVVLIGYADWIVVEDGVVVLEDLKSGWDSKTSGEHEFQGSIYSWMAEVQYPGRQIGYRVRFARHENLLTDVTVMDVRDFDRLEARCRAILRRMLAAQKSGDFPANPGSWCRYCTIAAKCAERNALVEHNAVVDDLPSAQKALGDRLILEAAFDQRDSALREYVGAAGPVELNGTTAAFNRKVGGPKISSVTGLIETLGMDEALEYLSVNGNKTKAKKVQNDPRLSDLWVPGDVSTKFEISNVSEGPKQ